MSSAAGLAGLTLFSNASHAAKKPEQPSPQVGDRFHVEGHGIFRCASFGFEAVKGELLTPATVRGDEDKVEELLIQCRNRLDQYIESAYEQTRQAARNMKDVRGKQLFKLDAGLESSNLYLKTALKAQSQGHVFRYAFTAFETHKDFAGLCEEVNRYCNEVANKRHLPAFVRNGTKEGLEMFNAVANYVFNKQVLESESAGA